MNLPKYLKLTNKHKRFTKPSVNNYIHNNNYKSS